MKTHLVTAHHQTKKSLIFGGLLLLVYPSLLALEKPLLFLGFSFFQFGLVVLAFYQPVWSLILHVSLLMALLTTQLQVQA